MFQWVKFSRRTEKKIYNTRLCRPSASGAFCSDVQKQETAIFRTSRVAPRDKSKPKCQERDTEILEMTESDGL